MSSVEEEFDEGVEEDADEEMASGSEELEDDLFDEPEITRKLVRTQSFEVLPTKAIVQETQKLIDDVLSVCNIPSAAAAALLLRHFK